VVLFGVEPGAVGAPTPDDGAPLTGADQAVVDQSLGLELGETLAIGGAFLTVVGLFDSATLLGGQPTAFVAMQDLQELAYTGAPVISAIAVRGDPQGAPPGLQVQSEADARADLLRPIAPAKDTITLLSVLLWVVAGCIIGSVIYLSALERVRDFAVFKAIGVSTSWVLAGLVMQAVVLSLAASVTAIGVAWLLAPAVSIPVKLPVGIVLFAPVTAVVVSAIASLAGVRRAVKVDPALAFG
jgi:putative ABC transport system permease protein